MYENHKPGVLHDKERRVALEVSLGLTNKQIAAKLDIALRTVEWLRNSAARRLGIPTSHLIIWAVENRRYLTR